MTGPARPLDWSTMMGEVAVALLSEPNAALSSERELRYGRRGSLAVHIAGPYAGWFRDHEAGQSGGVLDLVQRECGGNRCEALTWLYAHGFLSGRSVPAQEYDPRAVATRGADSRKQARAYSIWKETCPLRGTRALPEPERGGQIEALRGFLNLASDEDFNLAVAWLLAALRPTGPYPVLVLTGEQGSAKSTCARMLRALVDPHEAALRAPPRNEHELFIAARNAHVLAFDNLSTVPAWLSDALCRLSTGAGFAARKLYTDDEESVISAERPVLLNSIDAVVTRGDLADRALVLTLEDTPKTERKTESELWADFERARPHILGALLDAMVVGLNRVAEIRLDELPRMADFATWVVACEPGVFDEGAFLRAYTRNRKGVVRTMMDAEPVASAICDLMRARRGQVREGMLVATVNFPFMATQNCTVWGCR